MAAGVGNLDAAPRARMESAHAVAGHGVSIDHDVVDEGQAGEEDRHPVFDAVSGVVCEDAGGDEHVAHDLPAVRLDVETVLGNGPLAIDEAGILDDDAIPPGDGQS